MFLLQNVDLWCVLIYVRYSVIKGLKWFNYRWTDEFHIWYKAIECPVNIGAPCCTYHSILVCSGSMVVTTHGLWTRRFLVRVSSGRQYSMRLDRLHRAYPSLYPFGVVHWVPVLSNIKIATLCESNRQLQLWTVFAGTVVNNYQFNGIQGWAGQLCQIRWRAVI